MGTDLIGAVVGVVGSGIIALLGWSNKRNSEMMVQITSSVAAIERVVTEMRIELPTRYVTKDELLRHIQNEERVHESINDQLIRLREELISIREWHHK
jgi:hypothetical protein